MLAADIEWIEETAVVGHELSSFLQQVHRARPRGKTQRFIAHVPGIGNPMFRNERTYPRLEHLDLDMRLLLLFRFWNIVEHWSPYRDLADHWPTVLDESIPELAAAGDRPELIRRVLALVARVNDTHTNLWSALDQRPPVGSARPSISVRFAADRDGDLRAVVVDAGSPEDVAVGDLIVAVNGDPVTELVRGWAPLYAASNEPTRLRDIAESLLDGQPGDVTLTLERGAGMTSTVVVERKPCAPADDSHELPGDTFQRLADDVAYLKVSTISAVDCATYIRAAADCSGLIVDLRAYPAEFLPFALGGHLVQRSTQFATFSVGHASNPGAFTMLPGAPIEPHPPHRSGMVVVLVDETTQSQAEYTAMALRACGAVVVGDTTAAADGNVSPIPLPGGLHTMISGIGVFYPDGTPTQRIGIVPDLRVPVTIDGFRRRRDEQLDAAIALIEQSRTDP